MTRFTINNQPFEIQVDADTPLLWVIREHAGLTGTKFGCGAGMCGACTVHVNGTAMRSCITPVSAAEGSNITTIEGLSDDGNHPVQIAWREQQVPQCGYCQSGQIMAAAALLEQNPNPSSEQIDEQMNLICRCGTHNRIKKGVKAAAENIRSR